MPSAENFEKIEWETVSCLFCGPAARKEALFKAPDHLYHLPGLFTVVRCQSCGFVFQDPRPREEHIGYCYGDDASYYKESVESSSRLKRKISDLVLANFFGYENLGPRNLLIKFFLWPVYLWMFRDQTIPRYKKNGTLLEIGCSYGHRLEKDRRRGWQVVGNELNAAAATAGREKKNLDIRPGSIYALDFAPASFDAIVFDMVLEHVYDPKKLLRLVNKWLKPGGEILFSVPYFEGFEFKLFKDCAYGLQLPSHLSFYNTEHLETLLAQTGFGRAKFKWQHVDRDLVASMEYRKKTGANVLKNKLVRKLVVQPFVFAMALLGQTSRLTVRAIKV